MKYLLIGNGPVENLDDAVKWADQIIQINDCRHATSEIISKTHYIFVSNTGEVMPKIMESLRLVLGLDRNKNRIYAIRLVYARNAIFYFMKQLRLYKNWDNRQAFKLSKIYKHYLLWPGHYPCASSISFRDSLRMEKTLRHAGMPEHYMPSTGLIAYDWITRRLMWGGDTLRVVGFTFEGWDRHPWDIEKQIIKDMYKPRRKTILRRQA